jgi:hypothetical protein
MHELAADPSNETNNFHWEKQVITTTVWVKRNIR